MPRLASGTKATSCTPIGGADGFNVMAPIMPGGLKDFIDLVVPELRRRGLFRNEYEGTTLRENLGLKRPANRFFAGKAAE